jgi:hypothetical protein
VPGPKGADHARDHLVQRGGQPPLPVGPLQPERRRRVAAQEAQVGHDHVLDRLPVTAGVATHPHGDQLGTDAPGGQRPERLGAHRGGEPAQQRGEMWGGPCVAVVRQLGPADGEGVDAPAVTRRERVTGARLTLGVE